MLYFYSINFKFKKLQKARLRELKNQKNNEKSKRFKSKQIVFKKITRWKKY